MNNLVLVLHWLPDGEMAHWVKEFPGCEFVDGRTPEAVDRHLSRATIVYGLPAISSLAEARDLRWIQLASAGVPLSLCEPCQKQKIHVTNLAGLYGPTIAEHALGLMLILSRNLHIAQRNQEKRTWDRSVMDTVRDLHGKTVAIVGLGNIGRHIARLTRAFGMRVLGCRRTPRPTPDVDRVYACEQLAVTLADADYVVVAAPLTRATGGMLGRAQFAAMKAGAFYVNVSRGGVAQEAALLEALQSGHLAGAGLDAYVVEPLPGDHPLWSLPNVVVSPHYSGETVNNSALPARRFTRNLRRWLAGEPLEGQVRLELGY